MISGSFILNEDDNGVLPRRVAARKINEATDVKLLKTYSKRRNRGKSKHQGGERDMVRREDTT